MEVHACAVGGGRGRRVVFLPSRFEMAAARRLSGDGGRRAASVLRVSGEWKAGGNSYHANPFGKPPLSARRPLLSGALVSAAGWRRGRRPSLFAFEVSRPRPPLPFCLGVHVAAVRPASAASGRYGSRSRPPTVPRRPLLSGARVLAAGWRRGRRPLLFAVEVSRPYPPRPLCLGVHVAATALSPALLPRQAAAPAVQARSLPSACAVLATPRGSPPHCPGSPPATPLGVAFGAPAPGRRMLPVIS
jgi:hypothetical protein